VVWGRSGQDWIASVLINHWRTETNYSSCCILACCNDLPSQTVDIALISSSV